MSENRLTCLDHLLMPVMYWLSLRELRKLENICEGDDLCDIPSLFRGYGHFTNINAKQVPDEIRTFYTIVREKSPQRVLEIDTYRGGTFYLWCKAACEHSTLISLDLPGSESLSAVYTRERIKFYGNFSKSDNQKLYFIGADSQHEKTFADVKAILSDNLLDFLFIDGDHSYKGVKRDFDLYFPLVRSGGLIAFHDILYRKDYPEIEVHKLWNELKMQYQHQEIIAKTGIHANLIGIGVLWKK